MKKLFSISSVLLLFVARSYGQAVPTASSTTTPGGFSSVPLVPWADGTVHYALSATEMIRFGYYGSGTTSSTALSGNVGYATLSETHPFTALYVGGVLIGQGGPGTTTYQNIMVSQALVKGKWVMQVSDAFSFLPQSPVAGVSGISGVGLVGTYPTDGPADGPAGGVLTYDGNRIGNTLSGSIERLLTARTSITGSGSWRVLHFLDDNAGLDTGGATGQVGINHSINLRNTVSVSAVYSTYTTTGLLANLNGAGTDSVTYQTKGINLTYERLWTRSLSSEISAGPQWVQSSSAQLIPNKLNAYVNARATYVRRVGTFGVRYTRGVNNGSGAFAGAMADSVSGSFSRSITRDWNASAWAAYTHTTGLLYANTGTQGGVSNGAINTVYGTIQVSHRFTRTISGFANYSAQNQDVSSSLASRNVFTGLSHTIGFGVTWAPRAKQLGDF